MKLPELLQALSVLDRNTKVAELISIDSEAIFFVTNGRMLMAYTFEDGELHSHMNNCSNTEQAIEYLNIKKAL